MRPQVQSDFNWHYYRLHVTPQAYFRFNWGSRVHPMVGAIIGADLRLEEVPEEHGGFFSSSRTDTNFEFIALVKTGIDFDLGRKFSLSLEHQGGILKDRAIFMPKINAVFAF